MPPNDDLTTLHRAWARGDRAAANGLMAAVYEGLRRVARRRLRAERADHSLAPTALVHEMYLRLRADSQAGLVAAILEHDTPPLSDRAPLAPPSLAALVRTCLEKNPEWQKAEDLARALKAIASGNGGGASVTVGRQRTRPLLIRRVGPRLIGALLPLVCCSSAASPGGPGWLDAWLRRP